MGGRRILLPGAIGLSAISSLLALAPLVLIWRIVRELLIPTAADGEAYIRTCGLWTLAAALASIIAYFAALSLSHLAAFRAETEMRRESMRRITALPLGFFDRNTTGRIRKIIDDNASVTHTFLAHQLPDLAGTGLIPIVAAGLVFVFDWRLGVATIVPVLVSLSIMGFMMGTRGREFMKSYMDSLEEMNTEAVEYVRGIPVVKVFQQTVFSFKSFHDSILRYRDMVYRYTLMWEKPMSAYTVIIHGFAYVLIPVSVLLMARGAPVTAMIVDLFFYILLTPVFAQCIMRSMYLNQAMGQAGEAIDRIDALLEAAPLPVAGEPRPVSGHDVEFRGVSFRYGNAEERALNDVSFHLPAGRTYALVGPSGGGKTTLARLVPRFWDVESGQVLIGGVDVRSLSPDALMAAVSFVFQNSRLFKTSLLQNIRFGNEGATREEIEAVVDQARCREIVDRLPQGLETRIGVEGTYLSGGERQRIALARALLKDAPIVVLDEATAFADPDNEHLIKQALAELTRGKTVLMIAHRLSSVVAADRILVIEAGSVVEQGRHEDLLAADGLYARMWAEYRRAVRWTLRGENRDEVDHA